MMALAKLKLDAKRRLSLGKLISEHVTGFNARREADGRIILEPTVDIPEREVWLYKNPAALASVRKGLDEAKKGKTTPLDPSLLDDGEE